MSKPRVFSWLIIVGRALLTFSVFSVFLIPILNPSVVFSACSVCQHQSHTCSFTEAATCDTGLFSGSWQGDGRQACTFIGKQVIEGIAEDCATEAEAKACACSGGGAGLSKPTCSIGTNKTTYNSGDSINISVNAGDNGEVYGGTLGTAQTAYPTLSGSGCGALVGFCPSINLCSKQTSEGQCANVCTSLRTTAVNPTASSRTCTISMSVSNGVFNGANSGTCSTTVTVVGSAPAPNLEITSFTVPDGQPGQAGQATVTVKNTGTMNVPGNFRVGFDRSGATLSCGSANITAVVSGLNASQTKTVLLNFVYQNTVSSKTAVAMVDSGSSGGSCQIAESNESDNVKTTTYNITGVCIPTAPTVTLTSPSNNSFQNTISPINLSWNSTFGTSCPGPNSNVTFLRLKNDTANSYVTSGAENGQNVGVITNMSFSLLCGKQYSWWVAVSSDGGATKVTSPTWTFSTQSCLISSFFQTLGGDVRTIARLDNQNIDNVPSIKYMSSDLATSPNSAGVILANDLIAVSKGGKFSTQGTLPGWNVNFQSPTLSGVDLSKVQYDRLLKSVLGYGGLSNAATQVCTNIGNTVAAPNGKAITYKCYGGGGDINLTISPPNILVLIPFSASFRTISAAPSMGTKVILFANGDLNVSSNVTMPNKSTGLVVVGSPSSTVTMNSALTNVDGIYIADTIDTGNSTTVSISGTGMLLGRSSVSLGRSIDGAVGETWTYEPRYLEWFKGILTPAKMRWKQLPGA